MTSKKIISGGGPAALLMSLMFGGAAAAQTGACVTADDLGQGIVIDYADGIAETYRRLRPSVSSVTGVDGSETLYRLEIAQGTHLLNYVEFAGATPDEQTRQIYDYGQSPESLPVPTGGGRFNPVVTVTSAGGTRTETQSQAYVEGEPLVFGACTYRVVDAVIAYETDDNYIESITYLPDLGIGFLAWSETDAGDAANNTIIGIRTGK